MVLIVRASCLYCPESAESKEHPLPAAFGEFESAPYLYNRICESCNNTRLGVLDEQFARCGPEGFFRRHYGVQGRPTHDEVNSFYRGSAGGYRLEMKARDPKLGIDLLLECDDGIYRQARQLIFVEKSGKLHHLPLRVGLTPPELRASFEKLQVNKPFDVHILYGPDEQEWVEKLIKEAWPTVTFGEGGLPGGTYQGAVTTVVLTDRYFRAVAKIGFHYFLTQFPQYNGSETIFTKIREFIVTEGLKVELANEFVSRRQHPLLSEMMIQGARPQGWQAHVLCAEVKPGACLAHVQMFLSEDWPAPIYTVCLASDSSIVDYAAMGHAYVYHADGLRGKYAGEAVTLAITREKFCPPPGLPVVQMV